MKIQVLKTEASESLADLLIFTILLTYYQMIASNIYLYQCLNPKLMALNTE